MCKNALAELEPDATTAKRAQYEAFAFALKAPGIVAVRNGSHADPDDHEYRVNVKDGIPVACECPADTYQDGACKHRVAIAIREPVLEAASERDADATPERTNEVATDGGHLVAETPDYTEHIESLEQGGKRYVRCEGCERELLTDLGGRDKLAHADDCPNTDARE